MEGRTTELLGSMSDLSLQVKSLTTSFQKHFSEDISREQLLQWMDAIFTDHEYERALVARVQGTCEWILERAEIQEWMTLTSDSSAASILWIFGYPGFGKTILAAWLTEYLRHTKHEELSYFFCYFGDEKLCQPLNILRSWISQLIKTNDKALEIARETYTGKYPKAFDPENVKRATELDLWLLFKRLNVGLGGLIFMIDGFDECVKDEMDPRNHTLLDARERFLKSLEESIEHTNARILIISRESADLRNRYRRALHSRKSTSPFWLAYRITREDTQNDIGLYTRAIVNDVLHKRTNDLKDDIVVRLVEKCDGMFLYLRRIQPRLKSKSTMSAGKLRAIIEDMPRGLDEAYDRDLQTICDLDSEDRERALSILRWVLYAARPLTVRELAEALLISVNDDGSVDNWLPQDDLPETWDEDYTDEQIMGLCGSLIDIRGGETGNSVENQTVHFVHFSVKEYLLGTVDIEIPVVKDCFTDHSRAQELITKTCLRYLCLKDFQQAAHSTITQFNTRAEKYAFLHYAALYMPTHLLQAQPVSPSIVSLCNALLDPSESRWLAFSEVHGAWNDGKFERFMEKFQDFYPNPLYYASTLGMFETVKYLLGCGIDINITGGIFATPLQAAASSGHTDSVRLLLGHGADVDLVNPTSGFGNALQAAAAHGHEGVVNLLLDHGANANLSGGSMENCIIAASASPGKNVPEATACRIIERLIDAGARIESANEEGLIALHEAARTDSPIIVEMLLKNGADINASNNEGATALHVATERGYKVVVRLLLEYSAAPKRPTEVGCTPLIGAAILRRSSSVKLLHDRGVDTDADDCERTRPLHGAANSGNSEISKMALSPGALVSQRNKDGFTALHWAACFGYSTSVTLLLDASADVAQRNKYGDTALHLAACFGHSTSVTLLLDAGADVSQANEYGYTALHMAASSGHSTSIKVLLDAGADLSQADKYGNTALHMAAVRGHLTVVKGLLKAGADVNRRDSMAKTALYLSIQTRHAEISKVLIESGADPSILDYFGRNCFDWVASLRLDVPLLQTTSSKTKEPSTVMDMYHQGILYALRKPNRFCDTKAMRISQDAGIDYGLLGRLLLSQKRRQDACTAFERQMQVANQTLLICDLCDVTLPREGVVDGAYYFCVNFVCTTCTNIDLCSTCIEEYLSTRTIDREGLELCEDHDFMKVPGDGWQDVPAGKVNKQGETEDEWLARLAIIDGDES